MAEKSPWASNAHRFPNDRRLRYYGYRIHARQRGKPAMWQSPDRERVLTEAEAMQETLELAKQKEPQKEEDALD